MRLDDPFEVLGVDPSVDKTALKRAYGQLIRQHRPDRDPEAFQRIHAAYVAAQRQRTAENWNNEEGTPLPTEFEVERSTPLSHRAPVPARRQPAAPTPLTGIVTHESEPVEFSLEIGIDVLVARLGQEKTAELLMECVEDLLLAGRGRELAAQMLTDPGLELLNACPQLGRTLLVVACAIAYQDAMLAHRLLHQLLDVEDLRHGGSAWLEGLLATAFEHGQHFRDAAAGDFPEPWTQLLTLLPVVSNERGAQIMDAAFDLAHKDPEAFFFQLGALPDSLLSVIEASLKSYDDEEQATTTSDTARLEDILSRIDKALRADLRNKMWPMFLLIGFSTSLFLVLLAAVAESVHHIGRIGLGIFLVGGLGVATFLGLSLHFAHHVEAATYRRCVRPRLLDLALEGVSPHFMVERMRAGNFESNMRRFHLDVRKDILLSLTQRLASGRTNPR